MFPSDTDPKEVLTKKYTRSEVRHLNDNQLTTAQSALKVLKDRIELILTDLAVDRPISKKDKQWLRNVRMTTEAFNVVTAFCELPIDITSLRTPETVGVGIDETAEMTDAHWDKLKNRVNPRQHPEQVGTTRVTDVTVTVGGQEHIVFEDVSERGQCPYISPLTNTQCGGVAGHGGKHQYA